MNRVKRVNRVNRVNRINIINIINRVNTAYCEVHTVSVLGRDKGYTVEYNPSSEGVPEGEARAKS